MTENKEGHRLAKIRIREERKPVVGDKFCSRCGQKGTVGTILQEKDMPFTEEGIRPDIIINPHAIPSRMTIGQLIETIYGKACAGYGFHGDCTAFNHEGDMAAVFGSILETLGYHSSGTEILYDGSTGNALQSNIFIGPTFYMRLKQMVKDKINYRARGPVSNLTRQTVQGRANDGGLRIGEMERDGIIANGMSYFLNDSLMNRGDEYYIAVCNQSGVLAFYNEKKDLFFSPMIDGPIQFTDSVTENMRVNAVSKYGRTFSIIRIPYAFKLLIQELGAMNIQLRIITSDTISHLTSLNYSTNIQRLLHTKSRIPEVIDHIMNGTPLPDKIKKPTVAKSDTSIAIPGGYKINDVVYSLVDYKDYRGTIQPGRKGIIKGPSTDLTVEYQDKRVNVDFGNGVIVNMLTGHISKKNPKQENTLFSAFTGATAATPAATPADAPAAAAADAPAAAAPADAPAADAPAADVAAPVPADVTEYKEGDTVKYLKDNRQDRLWTIDGIDGEDIIISTEDFVEGEEGWVIVTKDEIQRENTGLKIGEDVELKTDPLPENVVEEIPLATLKEQQSNDNKEEQKASTPTLFQTSLTDKKDSEEKQTQEEGKKEISI